MTEHPDLETLSASLDGEELGMGAATHLETCAACRDRLVELRAVQRAVGRPPERGAAPGVRDRAIARALDVTAEWAGPERGQPEPASPTAPATPWPPARKAQPERPERPSTGTRWWLTGSAAAALVLVVALTAGLVSRGSGGGGDSDTALSGGPGDRAVQGESAEVPAVAPESMLDGGDLGDVSDVATLRARVGQAPTRNAQPAPAAGGSVGAMADSATPTARIVGTRVCEIDARAARPQVGLVVYAATVRYRGTAAVVLGFADQVGGSPVTLLVLAPGEGCRLLAESTPP
ncbi:MAG: hypothetical protein ABR540_20010 [Acidimicrobiales bacterium]